MYRYAAPVYCDIKHIVNVTEEDGTKVEESVVKHDKIFLGEVGKAFNVYLRECILEQITISLSPASECMLYMTRWSTCGVPQVPIMLLSDYCSLHDQDDMQLSDLGECPYDQVYTINMHSACTSLCLLLLDAQPVGSAQEEAPCLYSLHTTCWLFTLPAVSNMFRKIIPPCMMCQLLLAGWLLCHQWQ